MAGERRLFLGVGSSVTGKAWIDRLDDPRSAETISQQHDLPEVLGRILAARGVTTDTVRDFLNPTLKSALPDPYVLQGVEGAAARIARAITAGEKIAVFGDYDVDGSTASALMMRFLADVGCPARSYVPNRLTEGYGPNTEALLGLRDDGADLVITVDCGISAHAPLAAASEGGLDVVVVDHHQVGETLPEAVAVVNPNRQDDLSGLGYLAAVGVTFLVVVAVNRMLREGGFYNDGRREPDLLRWLDLVALGTVCDVVPLVGLNRAFVSQGLKVMAARGNTGLRALATVARLTRRPDTYAAGFVLGPRINAGGRLGRSDHAVTLLTTDDDAVAQAAAEALEKLNEERQASEARILDMAILQAEQALGTEAATGNVVVSGENWHPGVVGIVASRLKDRFGRPSIAISFDADGTGTGSGRSIPGVDLGKAVRAGVESGLLVKGGGHAMAAGLTIEKGRLGAFRGFLDEALSGELDKALANPGLHIDGALSAGGATATFIESLERAGPFGTSNPRPRLAFPAHRVVHASIVGEQHVRCTLASGDGRRLAGICFRSVGTPLGKVLLESRGQPFHFAGHLSLNVWGGKATPQLAVEDAASTNSA